MKVCYQESIASEQRLICNGKSLENGRTITYNSNNNNLKKRNEEDDILIGYLCCISCLELSDSEDHYSEEKHFICRTFRRLD